MNKREIASKIETLKAENKGLKYRNMYLEDKLRRLKSGEFKLKLNAA